MKGDTPIDLLDITKMNDAQFAAHLRGIRDRREAPIRAYEEMLELKEKARIEGLTKKYDQQMGIMQKDMECLDKNIEKVEDRWLKLRALKLEIDS